MNNKEEKVGDDEAQGRESQLISKLPNDMVYLISEYLHLFDYMSFRASCRTFQSVVLPLPQKRTYNLLPVPIFNFFFLNDDGLCQMMDPSRDTCCCNRLQLSSYEPDPFSVEFSNDGWLVVHNPAWESIEFLNPFTREWWNFPFDDDQPLRDLRSVGFSTNPDSLDCVTAVFDIGGDERVPIRYIKHGDETWKHHAFENQEHKFWPGRSSPVYFAGAFYVLGIDGQLGEFKVIEDEEETWKVYGRPAIQNDPLHSYHLMKCGEKLLAVFIGYMGKWVQVFKFNLSELKWIRVKRLGNFSLFISNPSSFSTQPVEGGMRNRIYVPRLKGNSIVFYSLDTGKFHVSGSEYDSFENLFGTTEPLHCFWF